MTGKIKRENIVATFVRLHQILRAKRLMTKSDFSEYYRIKLNQNERELLDTFLEAKKREQQQYKEWK